MKRRSWGFWALLLFTGYANAAELALPTVDINAGASTTVPFMLAVAAGQTIAAVQFELQYDVALVALGEVRAGAEATRAGKSVSANELEPGRVRIIVAGLNQNALASGELLLADFQVPQTAPSSMALLSVASLVMSSPTGRPVPADAVSGTLRITGSAVPPPPPPPTEGCGCLAGSEGDAEPQLEILLIFALSCIIGMTLARAGRTSRLR